MTDRELFACCSKCSGTFQVEGSIVEHRTMVEVGLALVDGVWTGLCEPCERARVETSNDEYQALVRAAAQISRIDNVGSLSEIRIPPDEGFSHEGETRFGFWVASRGWSDASFERFRRTANAIVERLNEDRGTLLLVNVNDRGTQAIVHGIVD